MIKTENKQSVDGIFAFSKSAKAVVQGVVTSYVFLVAAFVVLAGMYTYTAMPDKYLSPAVNILSAISIFTSGYIAAGKMRSHGWLHGAMAGLVFALVRIAAGLAIFKSYVPTTDIWVFPLLSVIISIAGGICAVNMHIKTPKQKKKKRKA